MKSSATSHPAGPPLVSVIACCYNHERFVKECLESIKRQNYPDLQIIITDDCSKDGSRSVIREWIGNNPSLQVTFLPSEQNRGLCKVLNHCLSLARGKYISLISTDDVWEPGKISEQVSLMESLPEKTGVVYSDAYQIDENGSALPKRFIETYRSFDRPPQGDIRDVLWTGNFIPGMTTLIRRSVFEKVGSYDEALFYEDWDMWLRMAEHYHFAFHSTPTARYRVINTAMSKASVDRMDVSNELLFVKHLLRKQVPKSMQNQAFNYAVRRAFRQGATAPLEGKKLLNVMVRIYKSPRLIYGWILYVCGFKYECYERSLKAAKRISLCFK